MIRTLRVRNFQSLRNIELDLDKFTVIVGPSNSGKSAVVRSLQALFENVGSPSAVSKGYKTFVIRVETDEHVEVLLERGRGTSTYRILHDGTGLGLSGGAEQIYTKSGTSVPEEVQSVLKGTEVEDRLLQFASQFDRPFLLSEPASKAAKVLGDLTDLDIVFEAVREANRRRLDAQQRLKTRKADMEQLRERAKDFADLKTQRAALSEAKKSYSQVEESARRRKELRALVAQGNMAEAALQSVVIPDVPEFHVEEEYNRLEKLTGLVREAHEVVEDGEESAAQRKETVKEIKRLGKRYEKMLKEAGTCPICGNQIEG